MDLLLINFQKYTTAIDENWECFSFVTLKKAWIHGSPETGINESFDRTAIVDWCKRSCKGDWVVAGGAVFIKESKDAMIFRLMFKDYHNSETKVSESDNDDPY